MYKKYNIKNDTLSRVLAVDEPEKVEARTRAFLQWVNFNKKNPQDMALAVLRQKNMWFLSNCELLVDDAVKCRGKTFKPYCYVWKDEYFRLINEARKLIWKYIEQKGN